MFSYELKIKPINSASNLKAFVSVTIDGVMEIDGFKVINGKNGLFVSVPSHKGTVMEEGVKVDKYFDDVRFPSDEGLEFANELKQAILNQYNQSASQPTTSTNAPRVAAAKAQANIKNNEAPTDSKSRKPLWGF